MENNEPKVPKEQESSVKSYVVTNWPMLLALLILSVFMFGLVIEFRVRAVRLMIPLLFFMAATYLGWGLYLTRKKEVK